ncbi:adenylyltransferase/cytidyltransferase family protein [bacterium]|nr:adenylyltransferase/cytidyltransferase family protein [bacterium]MBT4649408.1 adenylyltransferase/cytidyltransferase family protein [bacterium]
MFKKQKPLVGYTTGVFDLFHIGHLNILKNSKAMCDKLIVGVTTDELVSYKKKKAFIPHNERMEIIRNLGFVDSVIAQDNIDKFEAWKKLKYDILFVADCWYGAESWKEYERKLKEVGVKVVYFPYTKSTSSTEIRELIKKITDLEHGDS